MIEILVPALLGSMLGAVAGLIPVVGTFASLLLVYPYLLDSSVAQILTFFVCLSSVSQFTGSVPALLLKIPGESSSLIAIKESSNILKQNLAGEAIAITALGSFFAGISAMLFTYLFLGMLDQFTATAFSNTVLTVLLLMLIVLFCVNNTNTVAVNIVFIASGLGLGLIGYNSLLSESILTFNNNDLRTGLPLYPVITGVFVVNEIIKGQYQYQNTELKITSGLRHFNIFSWFRGTVIGYLGGFLPMAGKVIGTVVGYNVEQRFTDSSLRKLLNAESANNSAIISSLLPLLLFGIPITLGEALIFDIIELKDFSFSVATSAGIFASIIPAIVVANFLGLIVAWPLAKQSLVIFRLDSKILFSAIVVILLITNLYVGAINNQMFYYLIVLILSSCVGYALKKYDTFPFIFAFILHDAIISNVYRFYLLNF